MVLKFLDFEEFQRILDKPMFTEQDVLKVNSYPYISLTEKCGDIKPNEIETVKVIADKNINRFFNVILTVIGVQNKEVFRKLLLNEPYTTLISVLKEQYSGTEFLKVAIAMFTQVMLTDSLGDFSPHHPIDIKIEGKMPQKFMSFRQMTADEWFSGFVKIKLYSFCKVFERYGLDAATSHLYASVGYSFYYNNPARYDISACLTEADALYKILTNAITGKNDIINLNYNQKGELLFKDL